jgi:methionyl-tRNA formyltransferase
VLAALPFVNLHFSLLPRWRGAAPVERALLAGDTETGVCLMQLEEGLDTGPVFAREVVPIGAEQTVDELRDQLVAVGSRLLVAQLTGGLGDPVPQEGEVTHAAKIDPRRARAPLGARCRAAPPPRPPRPGVDDVPGPAAQGPAGGARP